MRSSEFYKTEMTSVKNLTLQPIDSITLVSLCALIADYKDYVDVNPNASIDEFYDYKKIKLIGQKQDTDEWKKIIQTSPTFNNLMSTTK